MQDCTSFDSIPVTWSSELLIISFSSSPIQGCLCSQAVDCWRNCIVKLIRMSSQHRFSWWFVSCAQCGYTSQCTKVLASTCRRLFCSKISAVIRRKHIVYVHDVGRVFRLICVPGPVLYAYLGPYYRDELDHLMQNSQGWLLARSILPWMWWFAGWHIGPLTTEAAADSGFNVKCGRSSYRWIEVTNCGATRQKPRLHQLTLWWSKPMCPAKIVMGDMLVL